MTLLRRIWHLLNRRRRERELLAELLAHREIMNDPTAFGDPHRLLEASRDAWGWQWLDDVVQDARFGLRGLVRAPMFVLTATLILALGIGVNVTFYQIATVTLLKPRAIQSPETLVRVTRLSPRMRSPGVPYPYGLFAARENTAFSAVLMQTGSVALLDDRVEPVDVSFVTANWFAQMGYGAWMGRVLSEAIDARADAPPVAVVSHQFWRTVLQADAGIVGSTVRLDGKPVTVVGVAPPDFPEIEPDDTAFWMPIQYRVYLQPDGSFMTSFAENNVVLLGRLRDGVSATEAQERLRSTVAALAAAQPEYVAADEWLRAIPLSEGAGSLDPEERTAVVAVLSLLGVLTTLIFLVAAANVGNLVLARAMDRSREIAVRLALGARRSRIARQLVIETVPVSTAGLAAGLLLAQVVTTRLVGALRLPTWLDFSLATGAIVVAVLLMTLGLIVVALLPAWHVARQDLTAATRDGGHQMSQRLDRSLVRRGLLAAQVGGSGVLLVVAGMAARSVEHVMTKDLGFEVDRVAVLTAFPGRRGIVGDAARAYWADARARVDVHPEVVASALVTAAPLGGTVNATRYDDAPGLRVLRQHVGSEYFAVMGIPLRRGRAFAPSDPPESTAIISERLAVAMFGSIDVLGKGFPPSAPTQTIVGVAADASTILVTARDVAQLYAPLTVDDHGYAQLLVRSSGDPANLLPALRQAALVDPRVVPMTRLLRDDFARRTRGNLLAATIMGCIGLLALALACVGVFGVVSHTAGTRRKEIAVHLALGAPPWAVQRVVHRHAMAPVAIGAVAGAILAVPVGLALTESPLQLQPADPLVFALELIVVLAATLAAAHLPLRRVLQVGPVAALREE